MHMDSVRCHLEQGFLLGALCSQLTAGDVQVESSAVTHLVFLAMVTLAVIICIHASLKPP